MYMIKVQGLSMLLPIDVRLCEVRPKLHKAIILQESLKFE